MEDPLSIDIVEPHRLAQNYYLRYSEGHEWFWASDMVPEEVMVFTTWDSKKVERATNCTYYPNILC
jgi:hypothetical protein